MTDEHQAMLIGEMLRAILIDDFRDIGSLKEIDHSKSDVRTYLTRHGTRCFVRVDIIPKSIVVRVVESRVCLDDGKISNVPHATIF